MLWLSAWVPDVPSSTWYPSGGAFATRAAPIMPPAPPAFSTITCWPNSSPRRGVKTRIRPSLPPPAARGITIVMGRLGQSWAARGRMSLPAPRRPRWRVSRSMHHVIVARTAPTRRMGTDRGRKKPISHYCLLLHGDVGGADHVASKLGLGLDELAHLLGIEFACFDEDRLELCLRLRRLHGSDDRLVQFGADLRG